MSRKCKYNVYNVGSDCQISIIELANLVRHIISPNKELKVYGDSSHAIGNFIRDIYVPNIDRARNEHDLDIWIELDDAIRRLED